MARLTRQVEPPVQPLLLNLDETAVSYSFHQAKGLFVKKLKRKRRCYSQVRKQDLRGTVTHVAIIANRSEVQPKLPQVIIGNHHRFTHGLLASVIADKPASVHLLRRKSSWNNTSVMCEILDLLATALQQFPGFQPILLLDTCGCHISDAVTALVPVPAGLTHLLQPLDVYFFAGYERYLRESYRQMRSIAAQGAATPKAWNKLLFDVCTTYLNSHAWAPAFAQVGLGPHRCALIHDLQAYFPLGVPAQSRDVCLSGTELAKLLPRGRKFRFLNWVRAPAGRKRSLTVH